MERTPDSRFLSWGHTTLAALAEELNANNQQLLAENAQLKDDLRLAIDAYRVFLQQRDLGLAPQHQAPEHAAATLDPLA